MFNVTDFLVKLVSKLPARLQPVVKSLVPFGVAVIVAGQDLVFDVVEVNEIVTLGTGAVGSIIAYALPALGYRPPASQ